MRLQTPRGEPGGGPPQRSPRSTPKSNIQRNLARIDMLSSPGSEVEPRLLEGFVEKEKFANGKAEGLCPILQLNQIHSERQRCRTSAVPQLLSAGYAVFSCKSFDSSAPRLRALALLKSSPRALALLISNPRALAPFLQFSSHLPQVIRCRNPALRSFVAAPTCAAINPFARAWPCSFSPTLTSYWPHALMRNTNSSDCRPST